MQIVFINNQIVSGLVQVQGFPENELQERYPDGIINDFEFTEDIDLYEYNEAMDTFELIQDWEDIKNQREADRLIQEFEQAKILKLREIKQDFENAGIRPRVDTTLGYDVDGGYRDLTNYKNARDLGVTQVKDADNNMQDVTDTDLETIVQKIKTNGLSLYHHKWDLENQVNETTTIEELENINW